MYIQIEKYIYYGAENAIDLITRCGEVCIGIDGPYIEWYA